MFGEISEKGGDTPSTNPIMVEGDVKEGDGSHPRLDKGNGSMKEAEKTV